MSHWWYIPLPLSPTRPPSPQPPSLTLTLARFYFLSLSILYLITLTISPSFLSPLTSMSPSPSLLLLHSSTLSFFSLSWQSLSFHLNLLSPFSSPLPIPFWRFITVTYLPSTLRYPFLSLLLCISSSHSFSPCSSSSSSSSSQCLRRCTDNTPENSHGNQICKLRYFILSLAQSLKLGVKWRGGTDKNEKSKVLTVNEDNIRYRAYIRVLH